MSDKYENSITGLPWTKIKINNILTTLKIGGTITFAFGFDDLKYLQILNEEVFRKRDDILLHIWSASGDSVIKKNEFEELIKLNYLKRLKINGIKNNSFIELENMNELEELEFIPTLKTDISFIQKFQKLKKVSLYKVHNLDILKNITSIEYLYLQTTIQSFDFARNLTNLKKIIIDSCISTNDFSPLNLPVLTYLGIHSIKKLDNVDSITSLSNLRELHLDASNVKLLPSFEKLKKLHKLSLRYMKVWENPDILKTIKALEELELMEINKKLKAEDFLFLTDLTTLKSLDFRFIDFNKGRIEKLKKYFEENNLSQIIKV